MRTTDAYIFQFPFTQNVSKFNCVLCLALFAVVCLIEMNRAPESKNAHIHIRQHKAHQINR